VERDADDLLPSIDLLLGYEARGEEYALNDEDNMVFAGLQFDWPLGDQLERAEYEVSKIEQHKRELVNNNAYYRLYTEIKNLSNRIEREHRLLEIAEERIRLARSVLTDETENYSFGRVTLNDYIQAVNALDSTRFNRITHEALYRRQVVEWLRLTDQLINRKDIKSSK